MTCTRVPPGRGADFEIRIKRGGGIALMKQCHSLRERLHFLRGDLRRQCLRAGAGLVPSDRRLHRMRRANREIDGHRHNAMLVVKHGTPTGSTGKGRGASPNRATGRMTLALFLKSAITPAAMKRSGAAVPCSALLCAFGDWQYHAFTNNPIFILCHNRLAPFFL
jgi:hypothetical protein